LGLTRGLTPDGLSRHVVELIRSQLQHGGGDLDGHYSYLGNFYTVLFTDFSLATSTGVFKEAGIENLAASPRRVGSDQASALWPGFRGPSPGDE
jgi:hypothetical protein